MASWRSVSHQRGWDYSLVLLPAFQVGVSVDEGSVTYCIAKLKEGDESAAELLWHRYYQRLVALARAKLSSSSRTMANEEDVAVSAFKSLWRGAVEGRFPKLHDRSSLWPLLVVLTIHKAHDQLKYEARGKRSGTQLLDPQVIEGLLSQEPTPEVQVAMNEICTQLFGLLSPALREVAIMKLEGNTNAEIGVALKCGLRTVERRLQLIRRMWDTLEPSE